MALCVFPGSCYVSHCLKESLLSSSDSWPTPETWGSHVSTQVPGLSHAVIASLIGVTSKHIRWFYKIRLDHYVWFSCIICPIFTHSNVCSFFWSSECPSQPFPSDWGTFGVHSPGAGLLTTHVLSFLSIPLHSWKLQKWQLPEVSLSAYRSLGASLCLPVFRSKICSFANWFLLWWLLGLFSLLLVFSRSLCCKLIMWSLFGMGSQASLPFLVFSAFWRCRFMSLIFHIWEVCSVIALRGFQPKSPLHLWDLSAWVLLLLLFFSPDTLSIFFFPFVFSPLSRWANTIDLSLSPVVLPSVVSMLLLSPFSNSGFTFLVIPVSFRMSTFNFSL